MMSEFISRWATWRGSLQTTNVPAWAPAKPAKECFEGFEGLNSASDLLTAASIVEIRRDVSAVRFQSNDFDSYWVVRDEDAAAKVAAEGNGLPVFTFEEVAKLHGKSPEMLRAVLNTKATFPTARVL